MSHSFAAVRCRLTSVVIASILVTGTCNATILFVTMTRDAIYVAADGRLTYAHPDGNETYGSVCKIRKFGNITVAAAGKYADHATNFDVWKIFASIQATSVADFARQIAATVPKQYQAIYTERSKRTGVKAIPDLFPGMVAVLGFEDGKPAFIRIVFYTINGVVEASSSDEGDAFSKNNYIGSDTIPVGEHWAVPALQNSANCLGKTHPPNPVADLRCELKQYISADPQHINRPIAIVKLTRAGSEWMAVGACTSEANHL